MADFSNGNNNDSKGVDVLIGIDFYYSFVTGEIKYGNIGEPYAIGTHCGGIICGKFDNVAGSGKPSQVQSHVLHADVCHSNPLNEWKERGEIILSHSNETAHLKVTIKMFWRSEGVAENICKEKEQCPITKEFEKSLAFNNKTDVVLLPFKQHTNLLPDNYSIASNRLNSLINRLNENNTLKREYNGILVDYYKHGIIDEVKECDHINPGEFHYLSHKAVYRTDKETTKTRIIFDASAAKNGHEPSLNDVLYSGHVYYGIPTIHRRQFTVVKFTVKFTVKFAVVKFAVVKFAVVKFAVVKFAVVKFAVVKFAVVKFAVVKLSVNSPL